MGKISVHWVHKRGSLNANKKMRNLIVLIKSKLKVRYCFALTSLANLVCWQYGLPAIYAARKPSNAADGREDKLLHLLWKAIRRYTLKLKKHIYYDTAHMTSETFAHVFKEKITRMFRLVLYVTVRNWKQSNFSLTREWLTEHYTAVKLQVQHW